jgi:hypothetical protein
MDVGSNHLSICMQNLSKDKICARRNKKEKSELIVGVLNRPSHREKDVISKEKEILYRVLVQTYM